MCEIITSKAKRLELIGQITVGFFFPPTNVSDVSFSMDCHKKKITSRCTIKVYKTYFATFTNLFYFGPTLRSELQ